MKYGLHINKPLNKGILDVKNIELLYIHIDNSIKINTLYITYSRLTMQSASLNKSQQTELARLDGVHPPKMDESAKYTIDEINALIEECSAKTNLAETFDVDQLMKYISNCEIHNRAMKLNLISMKFQLEKSEYSDISINKIREIQENS